MKQIHITRDSSGKKVTFETVSIDTTENVFFTNLDTKAPHWPTLSDEQVEPPPSPKSNSSQFPVPQPEGQDHPPYQVTYKCKLKGQGHEKEQGIINVFAPLAAANQGLTVAQGEPINEQVVTGGMSPYTITDQVFQVTDANGNVIKSGSGSIGPGLQLDASSDNNGIWVVGTPTMPGTYNYTFTVDDAMERNLQQVQYSIEVK